MVPSAAAAASSVAAEARVVVVVVVVDHALRTAGAVASVAAADLTCGDRFAKRPMPARAVVARALQSFNPLHAK